MMSVLAGSFGSTVWSESIGRVYLPHTRLSGCGIACLAYATSMTSLCLSVCLSICLIVSCDPELNCTEKYEWATRHNQFVYKLNGRSL